MSQTMSIPHVETQVRPPLPPLPAAGTRGSALALATLAFFGGFAGVAVFGPLVPKFEDLLGLSPLAAAFLAAVPSLTGSLLRIPFGAAVERLGGKRPFLALLGVTIAGMIGLLVLLATRYPAHMAGTFPLLLGLGVLIGAGVATFSVGVAQVSFWFPKREQGGALGAYGGLGNLSPALSTILLPLAVGTLGIVAAYQLWLAALVAIALAYAFLAHDAPVFQARRRGIAVTTEQLAALGGGDTMPSSTATRALADAAREPVLWALVGFYFLSFGGFLALTAWLPSYWHNMYGATLRDGALLTAAFALVAALCRVFGGVLSDRLPIRFALGGNFVLIAAGLFAVAFSSSLPLSLAGTLLTAAGMGLQNAIVFKLVPIYVKRGLGGAAGWIGGLGAVGGFVLPPMMGFVTGLIGGPHAYALGFLPIAILAVLALPPVVSLEFWNRAHHIEVV